MKQNQSTLIAGLALVATTCASQAQSTFSDVPDNHWAAAAVKRLAAAGIIEGFPMRGARQTTQKAARQELRTSLKATRVSMSAAKISEADLKVALVAKVKAAWKGDKSLDGQTLDVDVNTQTSQVTLTGSVRNSAQKQRAEELAKQQCPGVTIINQIKVATN
jgi:IS4 transposase